MSKTTNKFLIKVPARAVRIVRDHPGDCPTRWGCIAFIPQKIGCALQAVHDWVKRAEVVNIYQSFTPSDWQTPKSNPLWARLWEIAMTTPWP